VAKRTVTVAERDVHSGIAEADDVCAVGAGDVGQKTRVLVDPPAAGLEAKVLDHRLRCEVERAVAPAQGDINAGIAEADDVSLSITRNVDDEARVLLDLPAAALEPEVFDHRLRIEAERPIAVAQRN